MRVMRRVEAFSGCRVLAHCVMGNHVHLLLEVPPQPATGLTDQELLQRLGALYDETFVAEVASELATARAASDEPAASAVHQRFLYRMHNLSEFMKGLMQRFTQWFNREHRRTGTLWEDRFKSVIVEAGIATQTVATYIDLNPVRAGIVREASHYRWSSYGAACAGSKPARAGLAAAWQTNPEAAVTWEDGVARDYDRLLSGKGFGPLAGRDWTGKKKTRRHIAAETAEQEMPLIDGSHHTAFTLMLQNRVRHFVDGAVIGTRDFVEEVFWESAWRFGARRRSGARRMRGAGAAASGLLWSARDLRLRL